MANMPLIRGEPFPYTSEVTVLNFREMRGYLGEPLDPTGLPLRTQGLVELDLYPDRIELDRASYPATESTLDMLETALKLPDGLYDFSPVVAAFAYIEGVTQETAFKRLVHGLSKLSDIHHPTLGKPLVEAKSFKCPRTLMTFRLLPDLNVCDHRPNNTSGDTADQH